MSNLNEALLEAMTAYVNERLVSEEDSPVVVVSYEQETVNWGYCETCWSEETNVVFTCMTTGGKTVTNYYYSGSLAELIRDLTD